MAKEIKETPILKGKDARRFEKAIEKNAKRRVSAEEYKRAKEAYKTFGFAQKAD